MSLEKTTSGITHATQLIDSTEIPYYLNDDTTAKYDWANPWRVLIIEP